MNENVFFVAFVLGAMIGLSLIFRIIKGDKANFFLGIVVTILSLEMLFSWGAHSGYNNRADSFPIHMMLNYLLIPPSLWLFIKYKTKIGFRFKTWHLLLFVPAFIEYVLQFLSLNGSLQLSQAFLWTFLSEYLPLIAYWYVIIEFWYHHFSNRRSKIAGDKNLSFSSVRFMILMITLTILALVWLAITWIDWNYFWIVEYLLTFLFFTLAFITFLESQNFPLPKTKKDSFDQYDDSKMLSKLHETIVSKELYLNPLLSLKELASETKLPNRYVSYLINTHQQKNYKEYINQYRVEAFLKKAGEGELEKKTVLALAFESGFNSKSTFNQVFKNHTGKTPTQYLKQKK